MMDTHEAVEELKAAVDNWNVDAASDERVCWYGDYSGRFMYGATCPGISGDAYTLALVLADVSREARSALGKPTTDSMGLGVIWYWPGVSGE